MSHFDQDLELPDELPDVFDGDVFWEIEFKDTDPDNDWTFAATIYQT